MGNGTTTEVEASIAGQKFRVTGHDVNMLFTVIGVVLSACIAYVVYDHQQDARQTGQSFVGAVKEQTVAIREATSVQREQTCLLKFEEKVRKDNADFCKQITRQ